MTHQPRAPVSAKTLAFLKSYASLLSLTAVCGRSIWIRDMVADMPECRKCLAGQRPLEAAP